FTRTATPRTTRVGTQASTTGSRASPSDTSSRHEPYFNRTTARAPEWNALDLQRGASPEPWAVPRPGAARRRSARDAVLSQRPREAGRSAQPSLRLVDLL